VFEIKGRSYQLTSDQATAGSTSRPDYACVVEEDVAVMNVEVKPYLTGSLLEYKDDFKTQMAARRSIIIPCKGTSKYLLFNVSDYMLLSKFWLFRLRQIMEIP
jgi:hypothetical protein